MVALMAEQMDLRWAVLMVDRSVVMKAVQKVETTVESMVVTMAAKKVVLMAAQMVGN